MEDVMQEVEQQAASCPGCGGVEISIMFMGDVVVTDSPDGPTVPVLISCTACGWNTSSEMVVVDFEPE